MRNVTLKVGLLKILGWYMANIAMIGTMDIPVLKRINQTTTQVLLHSKYRISMTYNCSHIMMRDLNITSKLSTQGLN